MTNGTKTRNESNWESKAESFDSNFLQSVEREAFDRLIDSNFQIAIDVHPESANCPSDSIEVIGEPLIPEGVYEVKYNSHHTMNVAGGGKLVIKFFVLSGEYEGTALKAFFPVTLVANPGKFGKFSISRQGKYFEQMCDLIPELTKGRSDRMSPRRLHGLTIEAKVVTVTSKWNGEERKPHTRYSKIDRLLRIVNSQNRCPTQSLAD